jgi:hypothetical protein
MAHLKEGRFCWTDKKKFKSTKKIQLADGGWTKTLIDFKSQSRQV